MKRRIGNLFILSLLIMGILPVKGQIVLSNPPSSVKWNQINTESFKVIFPSDSKQDAKHVANTLQHLYSPVSNSLDIDPGKISVVLQSRNTMANGFVTLAPRRSEFFTMSPQTYAFLGTNDWLDLLSVHEYRHVVQFDKSKTGFTKLAYWAMGEFTQGGLAFAAVPVWFWEGDAVGIETALTNSGRGRLPNFSMALRASFLEKGPFNYHKQYLGSFRDFIPDHYVFGYHLTTYLRDLKKQNIWEPILSDAFSKSFIPFTFSNALKKYTGEYITGTYNNIADSLQSIWREQTDTLNLSSFERVNNRASNVFTNYYYPQVQEDGSAIALKSGFSDIPVFIRIHNDGTESKVFVPGFQNNPGYISTGKNLLVWTEFQYDPRWDQRSYSVVKTLDLKTGIVKKITNKTRYSGAAISPDGSKIVVVNNAPDGNIELRLIGVDDGDLIKSFPNTDNNFYSMPGWSSDSKHIVVIKHFFQSKEIVRIDIESGLEEVLLSRSAENVGYPVLWDHYLFFNSDVSGIDNVYALDLNSGQRWQITNSKYGAFNPSVKTEGEAIYYNDFTVNGMDIVRIPFDPETWSKSDVLNFESPGIYDQIVLQENNPDILKSVPDKDLPVSTYSKGANLFHIHSWGPYFGTSTSDIKIGTYFQDILSQNRGFLGYNYNVDEKSGKWLMNYSYQGLFPIVDAEASIGDRKTTEVLKDSTNNLRTVNFKWKERGFKTGLRIPLELTNSKYRKGLSFSELVSYNRVSDYTNDYVESARFFKQQGDGNLLANEFSVNFYNLLKTSKRDINSRWGQTIQLTSLSTPFGGDYSGELTAITTRLYFPGLFRHHSTNFLGAYQKQKIAREEDSYWFSNRVPFPRGYSSSAWEQFYTLRSNYAFTIWNADLALGPILNIQRIRTVLFYDTALGEGTTIDTSTGQEVPIDRSYWSAGAEFLFDFNFMRLLPLLNGGFRAVYTPDNKLVFQLVIGNIQI